ncbi:hypothetical protein [Roseococcus microcysteis]|uniref:hypothetical protein n=1 Tax=Roseococcus microcysteis TaxID=2771361 RepID=UPI00168AF19D|nr:hypothetical protein [Roseococcus microcysteis]
MDDDATVRLARPGAVPASEATPPRRGPALAGPILAGLGLAVLVAGGAALWWWPREGPPPEAPLAMAPPVAAPPPPMVLAPPPAVAPSPEASAPLAPPLLAPPSRSQAEIAAHVATRPTLFRWDANPLVFVLDFPDLASQGAAMNRAAALIEKARTPRDRVLDDTALAAAIAADRNTPSDYYFGHNYRASDLTRMFALAERDGIALNPREQWLREQVALVQSLAPGRDAAILTIPGLGPEVSPALRAAILRHELAHGQFFTLPMFAAHVMAVWHRGMTEQERAAIRAFLGREGYDTAQEEMMANEAMAYILHTPDRAVFDPVRELGWDEAQVARIRALFAEGAPPEP